MTKVGIKRLYQEYCDSKTGLVSNSVMIASGSIIQSIDLNNEKKSENLRKKLSKLAIKKCWGFLRAEEWVNILGEDEFIMKSAEFKNNLER